MKKKLIPLILALVCAVSCAFGLSACGGNEQKVKNEAQWKQAIADAHKSDAIKFQANLQCEGLNAEIRVEALGKAQHLIMSNYDSETDKTDTWEYYYDGDYVYLNVKEQDLGYDWQKIKADTVTEEFAEPLSYIDLAYSGELANDFDIDIKVDDLDKLSERYADAVFGVADDNMTGDSLYKIADGDISYYFFFVLKSNYTEVALQIFAPSFYLFHSMGDSNFTVTIPTESVQEAE